MWRKCSESVGLPGHALLLVRPGGTRTICRMTESEALTPVRRRRRTVAAVAAILTVVALVLSTSPPRILPQEPLRTFVPENGELIREIESGRPLVEFKGGARHSVVRIFVPRDSAQPAEVLDVLVRAAEESGWQLRQRDDSGATLDKFIESRGGQRWVADVLIKDGQVRLLLIE